MILAGTDNALPVLVLPKSIISHRNRESSCSTWESYLIVVTYVAKVAIVSYESTIKEGTVLLA
jgi:hypothetical protein